MRLLARGETDAVLVAVKDTVVCLEEGKTCNKVEALATNGAKVTDQSIVASLDTTVGCDLACWDQVLIWGQCVCLGAESE